MSENEIPQPKKQTSSVPTKHTERVTMKQTASVPLKKETVRVTLKASDVYAVPSATLPVVPRPLTPPPTSALATPEPPSNPQPLPAPTIPLKTAGPPSAAGAPTVKLAGTKTSMGAPTIALKTANAPLPGGSGAPTIPLKTANAPLPGSGAPTIPLKTTPATMPGAPAEAGKVTAALPKATVALNPPTKPLTGAGTAAVASQKPTLMVEEDEEESGAQTFTKILSGVGLVAALVVLGLQLKMSHIWIGARDQERIDDWALLLE